MDQLRWLPAAVHSYRKAGSVLVTMLLAILLHCGVGAVVWPVPGCEIFLGNRENS